MANAFASEDMCALYTLFQEPQNADDPTWFQPLLLPICFAGDAVAICTAKGSCKIGCVQSCKRFAAYGKTAYVFVILLAVCFRCYLTRCLSCSLIVDAGIQSGSPVQ